MTKIHVQRLVSVWVEDTYEVENTREETIRKAVNYEFDPISGETMWDSMVDSGPVEVLSEDYKTKLYNEQIYQN